MPKFILAVAALLLCAVSASAATVTPATPVYYYGGGYRYYWPYYDGYRPPACPYRHHWACWIDPYGQQGCGCLPDFGLYPGLY